MMEEFKSESEKIKEALSVLIIKLEKEEKYSSAVQYLKDFQEEFKTENPNKDFLLSYLDQVFKNIPNWSSENEEGKKIITIINHFNTMCQDYIENLVEK